MSEGILTLNGLTVGYDGAPVQRGVDLSLARGEIVTLIGPNGGGKSTILKTAARRLGPLGGAVLLDGADIAGLSAHALAKAMAVVLTERADPELTTCFDFVAAGRYPHTGRFGTLSDRDRRAVRDAMEAVGCAALAERDVARISDGQRQRLVIARALCQEPRVMLLDEPTSFLDIRHKLALVTLLRTLARARGIAMLVSMHEIDLAQRLADRVLCVSGDAPGPAGRPEDVFTRANIQALYGLPEGAYDPVTGGVELPRVTGAPGALVLSSGGSGVSVYRALQREGVPFAAAILRPGELDHHLAMLLAVETVEERPYVPLGRDAVERALALVKACDRVIDAGVCTDGVNEGMKEVLDAAKGMGKLQSAQA